MLTYGDGLSNVDFNKLLKEHQKSNKLVTVTAVHPIARFGELKIDNNNNVISFKEKPQTQDGWINGSFFVIEPKLIKFIKDDKTILEEEPLEKAANIGEFHAFKHEGFGIAWIHSVIRISWKALSKKAKYLGKKSA